MKRTHFFGTMIAFLTAASAVAAGQQAASEQTTGSEKPKTVVVVGCLASGPQSSSGAVGTSGTAGATLPGASASASSFILVNATMSSGGSGASTTPADTPPANPTTPPSSPTTPPPSAYPGTAGTSGAAASGAGPSYLLTGGDSTELQRYLNSKVEIRGTLDTKRSAADAPSASTTGTATSSAPAQHLRVTSVKQIAESCSQ